MVADIGGAEKMQWMSQSVPIVNLPFIPANFWCVRQYVTRERTDQFFGSKNPTV
jgi:hypothetical protein